MTDETEPDLDMLRVLVNESRMWQLRSVAALRARVLSLGYPEARVEPALRYWANYVRERVV